MYNRNPFIVSVFEGPEYFCNRKNEMNKLKEAFDNRRNVTMFSLTNLQWKLVSSISKEDRIKEPLSISFIKKYDLNSASSLKRALDALLKKEIIIYYKDHFQLNDLFFSIWLKNYTL